MFKVSAVELPFKESFIDTVSKMKPKITITIIGHLDAGKSTCTGHLLRSCGPVDQTTIDRLQAEAVAAGKDGAKLKYAWLLDTLQAERDRGISIDISQGRFETEKYSVNIVDVPGHRDFLYNTINGILQADCVLLIISANPNEFASGISPSGQTREHLLLAHTLGVKNVIVAVNKMDETVPPYCEKHFSTICEDICACLRDIELKPRHVPIVPISGLLGDNLLQVSSNMHWFKREKTGEEASDCAPFRRTLEEAIDNLPDPERPAFKPLRIPLKDVDWSEETGAIPMGRVESGVLRPGLRVTFAPSMVSGEVKTVTVNDVNVDQALPGDDLKFTLTQSISVTEIKRGHVVGDSNRDPPKHATHFRAKVVVLDHKTGDIEVGASPVLDCHTAHVACRVEHIRFKYDRKTSEILEEGPIKSLQSRDCAVVDLVPLKPVCVERTEDYPALGRFVLRGMRAVLAVGEVLRVHTDE